MNEAEYAELRAIRAAVEENTALLRSLFSGAPVAALAVDFVEPPAPPPVHPGVDSTIAVINRAAQRLREARNRPRASAPVPQSLLRARLRRILRERSPSR